MRFLILTFLFSICLIENSLCDKKHKNKYSAEANIPNLDKYEPDIRELQKPFRMAKLNLVFSKAQQVNVIFLFFSLIFFKLIFFPYKSA